MPTQDSLAESLRRTVSGPMWHGPALDELLENVSAESAAMRAIPGAHTIWELVLHITTWACIVRERIAGRSLATPEADVDWPPQPAEPTDDAWRHARERLRTAYDELGDVVARMPDVELRVNAIGQEFSVRTMIRGVVEHGTYHGGQIAILRRAITARGESGSPASDRPHATRFAP